MAAAGSFGLYNSSTLTLSAEGGGGGMANGKESILMQIKVLFQYAYVPKMFRDSRTSWYSIYNVFNFQLRTHGEYVYKNEL